jgi:hypothetical protein
MIPVIILISDLLWGALENESYGETVGAGVAVALLVTDVVFMAFEASRFERWEKTRTRRPNP